MECQLSLHTCIRVLKRSTFQVYKNIKYINHCLTFMNSFKSKQAYFALQEKEAVFLLHNMSKSDERVTEHDHEN